MADSFELLKARIAIDVTQVSAAIKLLDTLETKIGSLSKATVKVQPVKVTGPKTGTKAATATSQATKDAQDFAKQLTESKNLFLEIEKSSANVATKLRALRNLRVQTAAKALSFDIDDPRRLQLNQLAKQISSSRNRLARESVAHAKQLSAEELRIERVKTSQFEAELRKRIAAEQLAFNTRVRSIRTFIARSSGTAKPTEQAALLKAQRALQDLQTKTAKGSTQQLVIEQQLLAIRKRIAVLTAPSTRRVIDPAEIARAKAVADTLQRIRVTQENLRGRKVPIVDQLASLQKQEAVLARLAKTANLTSQEFEKIARAAARIREMKIELEAPTRLLDGLKAVRQGAIGLANSPGVPQIIRDMLRMTAAFLAATFSAARFFSVSLTTAGSIVLIGVSAALAAISLFKLVKAVVDLGKAIVKSSIEVTLKILIGTLTALLAPTRFAYEALKRLFSIQGFITFSEDVLGVTAAFDTMRQQLKLRFGSEADGEFQRLAAEADLFGFSLLDVTSQYAKFALATKDTGLALGTLQKLFTGIQATSAVFGLQGGEIEGILFALQQIQAKGKLTSEELVRQLGNRLPGAVALAARSLKITTVELQARLEAGTVTANEFAEALANQTILEFYDKAIGLTDRLSARLQRLSNIKLQVKDFFGTLLSRTVVFGIEKITAAFIKMRAAFEPIIAVVNRIANQIQFALTRTNFARFASDVSKALTSLVAQLQKTLPRVLSFVAALNFGAIAIAIAVATSAMRLFNKATQGIVDKFRQLTGANLDDINVGIRLGLSVFKAWPAVLARINTILDSVFQVIKAMFKVAYASLQLIIPLLKLAQTLIRGFFGAAGAEADKAIQGLIGSIKLVIREVDSLSRVAPEQVTGLFEDIGAAFAKSQFEQIIDDIFGGFLAIRDRAITLFEQLKAKLGFGSKPATLPQTPEVVAAGKSDILGIEEFVRQLNSATVSLVGGQPDTFEKQTAENTKSAAESLTMLARSFGVPRGTPFIGQMPAGTN